MSQGSRGSGENGVYEANLRYLSQLQNPSLNKLISTLASDLPLDAKRIKESFLNSPLRPTTPTRCCSHLQDSSHAISEKRVRRSISCNIDPEVLTPQHAVTPTAAATAGETITNLPTSYLGSLFSPSVFRSPSNSAQYFTFDNYPYEQQGHVTTPPRSQTFKQSPFPINTDHNGSQTPRFDEKEFYALLCDSPRDQELKQSQHGNRLFGNHENHDGISPSSASLHSSKKVPVHQGDEGEIDPDVFLALENWVHLQTTTRGEAEFGVDPIHSSDFSRFSNTEHSNIDHGSVSSNQSEYHDNDDGEYNCLGVNFSLPSLPKLPHVVPTLSIMDLDHVFKTSWTVPPPVLVPAPSSISSDFETKDLPQLPPLPSIPLSVPLPLPLPSAKDKITPPPPQPTLLPEQEQTIECAENQFLDDEKIDLGECQSLGQSMSGTYGLCKQLIKYFNEVQNPEKDFKALDPDDLARILNVRCRRMKDLFQILETLHVVCSLTPSHISSSSLFLFTHPFLPLIVTGHSTWSSFKIRLEWIGSLVDLPWIHSGLPWSESLSSLFRILQSNITSLRSIRVNSRSQKISFPSTERYCPRSLSLVFKQSKVSSSFFITPLTFHVIIRETQVRKGSWETDAFCSLPTNSFTVSYWGELLSDSSSAMIFLIPLHRKNK
jgi:hypothetical protein